MILDSWIVDIPCLSQGRCDSTAWGEREGIPEHVASAFSNMFPFPARIYSTTTAD